MKSLLSIIIAWLNKQFKPKPDKPKPYIITKGQSIEKTLTVPCKLSFYIKNIKPEVLIDKAHFAWAYSDGGNWNGGNPEDGTYGSGLRYYKLKVKGITDSVAKEGRWDVAFNKNETYKISLEVGDNTTSVVSSGDIVLGKLSFAANAGEKVTIGLGNPPSQRPGIWDAEVYEITFEEFPKEEMDGEEEG